MVSAYWSNVAFIKGAKIEQFAPQRADVPDLFEIQPRDVVVSIKAETHNFPTTVEPFYGASTGSGGEIRDRMAGGRGGIPLIGAAAHRLRIPDSPDHQSINHGGKDVGGTPLEISIASGHFG